MKRGPTPFSRALFSMLGMLFIFIGVILIILGLLTPTSKAQVGGLILIGPIPLIFRGELSPILLLIIMLLPVIIFILMLFFVLQRISLEEKED